MFTYAVLCANGSIGRGEGLGTASWAHLGKVDLFEKRVLEGLEEIFNVGQEFMEYIVSRKQDQNDKRTHITRFIRTDTFRQTLQRAILYYQPQMLKVTDPKRIEMVKKDRTTLWEGYNAITAQVWHSDIPLERKSRQLRIKQRSCANRRLTREGKKK